MRSSQSQGGFAGSRGEAISFIDRTWLPKSVYAAYNLLGGKKEMINRPEMGHAAPADIQALFWAALESHLAEKKGAAVPVAVPAVQ